MYYRQSEREYQNRLLLDTVGEIKDIFQNENEVFEDEDIESIDDVPETKRFPFFIFSIALVKDIIDYVSLTGVGLVLTTLTSLSIAIIIFCWILLNGGGAWKKRVMKMAWRRFVIFMVLENVPYINLIPFTSILIWMIYNKEKKIVRLFNIGLEKLKNIGF